MSNDIKKRIAVTALTLSLGGLLGIGANEGLRTVAYQDSGGVWTNGYGHIQGVYKGQVITKKQAEEWLREDAKVYEAGVKKALNGVELFQYEFDALVDHAFNIGNGAFAKSTIVKKFREGKHLEGCDHLFDWLYVGKTFNKGLLHRRLKTYKKCTGLDTYYDSYSGTK